MFIDQPTPVPPGFYKAIPVEVRLGERYAATHGGLLPNDQWWNAIRARFDLRESQGPAAVANFAHYHPYAINLLLKEWQVEHTPPPPPVVPVVHPMPPVPPLPPPPEVPPPTMSGGMETPKPPISECPPVTAVPEPSTGLLALIGGMMLVGGYLGGRIFENVSLRKK